MFVRSFVFKTIIFQKKNGKLFACTHAASDDLIDIHIYIPCNCQQQIDM